MFNDPNFYFLRYHAIVKYNLYVFKPWGVVTQVDRNITNNQDNKSKNTSQMQKSNQIKSEQFLSTELKWKSLVKTFVEEKTMLCVCYTETT